MMPGHTKFGPDRMFGMFKKVYIKARVNTLADIQDCFTRSSISSLNKSVLTFDPVSETRTVTWYDWVAYLGECFSRLPGRLRTTEVPGVLAVRERVDSEEHRFNLLRKGLQLSAERYFKIDHFEVNII